MVNKCITYMSHNEQSRPFGEGIEHNVPRSRATLSAEVLYDDNGYSRELDPTPMMRTFPSCLSVLPVRTLYRHHDGAFLGDLYICGGSYCYYFVLIPDRLIPEAKFTNNSIASDAVEPSIMPHALADALTPQLSLFLLLLTDTHIFKPSFIFSDVL